MPELDRPRRNRRTEALRGLAREAELSAGHLILPVFAVPGPARAEPIAALPGVSRMSVDLLTRRAERLSVPAVLVFGVPDRAERDVEGKAACSEEGVVPAAVRALKAARPDLAVITDVCLCAYLSHGHCGLLDSSGDVDNDATLELLARMAVVHAAAGADVVAPSAMMDGQVAALRSALNGAGFRNTGIMSYAAKFASVFYGPFREAACSAPSFGDRRAYQLPPSNRREAIRDALLDEAEGADWLMVKPALPYLDVVAELRARSRLPIAVYQVSGEYAMIKSAAAAGAFPEREAALEAMLAMRRAGADAIISYFAEEACSWLAR